MKNKVFAIIFALILAVISVGTIVYPKKDFSDNENRNLASFPKISWNSVKSGRFTDGVSDYFTDHMIFRDTWVSVKTAVEKALGRHESGSIQVTKDNMLIQSFSPEEEQKSEAVLDKIAEFDSKLLAQTGIKAVTVISPTATQIYSDRLYADCMNADCAPFFEKAENTVPDFVDLVPVFAAHRDENIFYRTDHHWTYLGAYYGYAAYCEKAGITPLPLGSFGIETVSDEFFGTTYSRYGLFNGEDPDRLETVAADKLADTRVTVKGEDRGTVFCPDKLSGKDKYLYFLGGNEPLTEVSTNAGTGRVLLVFKDSYANSCLPYLCFHFDRIILVDMRYYTKSVFPLVAEYGATDVLLMYNLNSLVEAQAALLPLD